VSTPDTAAPGRREQTKASNRAAIIEAGRGVFAELGYGAATVRDIIRRTDLASGTFYNYFPDKESVFRAVLEESARAARARVRAARLGASDPESFVHDGFHAYFAFVAEDPGTFALTKRNSGTIRALAGDPSMVAGFDELATDLRAAVARGWLPDFDADYMAAAMVGTALEVGARMVDREPVDVDGAAAFATALFLGGIERLAR
jgi:AcrR family transcriptional regulator